MATNEAQPSAASAALVRHDPRPLLVQAIDRCLELGTWTTIDLDQLIIDIVNMGFRYLDRLHRDRRDLDAVGDTTDAVLMYIDDGLRMISGQSLDVAATFLATDPQPLLTAFRTSWGAWDRLRSATTETVGGIEPIHVGPPGKEVALDPVPESFLHVGPKGQDSYGDAALLDAWRRNGTIADRRGQLDAAVALLREQYALLRNLPFPEATSQWKHLLFADATFDPSAISGLAFHLGWASTLIRAVERDTFGIVVTIDELTHFLASQIRSSDEGTQVSAGALLAAERVIAPALSAVLGRQVDDAVRYALREAAGWIVTTMLEAMRDGLASGSNEWLIAWGTNTVFLAVGQARREQALETVIGPMGPDEIVDRFEEARAPDEREQLLGQLDLASLPIGEIARLLEASPRRAEHILRAAKLSGRAIDDLEALALADITDRDAGRHIAGAIIRSSANLTRLSNDAILALSLRLQSTRDALRLLLTKTRMDPERLLRAFRDADDANVRQEWVALAMASSEHFTYLVSDVCEVPRFAHDIVAPFSQHVGLDTVVWIPASFTVACFLEAERRQRAKARRWRKRRLLGERGEPVLLDPDLRWLWSQLPPHQQDPVRAAFRKADRLGKRPHAKTKPVRLSKKAKRAKHPKRTKAATKRSKRSKKRPKRSRKNTRR